jgi:hypothetical protein
MTASSIVNEEPTNSIMTVSWLRQLLEKYPSDMSVFIKNDVGGSISYYYHSKTTENNSRYTLQVSNAYICCQSQRFSNPDSY